MAVVHDIAAAVERMADGFVVEYQDDLPWQQSIAVHGNTASDEGVKVVASGSMMLTAEQAENVGLALIAAAQRSRSVSRQKEYQRREASIPTKHV